MTLSPLVQQTLTRLEERSRREQPELDELNARGAAATRAAAPRLMLDVGPDVGRLLNLLARILGARHVVEVGGSSGYSTIWLAEAMAGSAGRVTSIEFDPRKAAEQRENLAAAGLLDHVDLVVEDASSAIPRLAEPVDLVLIDHWKDLYIRDFDLVWPKVRPGGLVVADNILTPEATRARMRAYVEHVRSVPAAVSYTVAVGDGIEITHRAAQP